VEASEYGHRAADATDSREDAYRDARSACLLYLKDNFTRYQEEGNEGWSPTLANAKSVLWTSTYPADLEDTMNEAHQEVARFDYDIDGTLGAEPMQLRRTLLRSMYPELREGAELTAAIDNNFATHDGYPQLRTQSPESFKG